MSEGAVFDIDPTASISESLRPIGVALQMLLKSGAQRVTIETIRPHRSLSANALYWTWLDALAKHFSKGGNKFDKDAMHDLMRHKFLGYEDKTVGKTVISQQLKSTADLTSSGMCEYMQQIDAWAADCGCLLPRPENNEYAEWAKAA
jgi:hypothetical protein